VLSKSHDEFYTFGSAGGRRLVAHYPYKAIRI
jgi:hypothetical protein